MFTLGIFTTHIPYIALVVFYAFFWIVGINKASAGELQPAKSSVLIELTTTEIAPELYPDDSFNAQNLVDCYFRPVNYNLAFAALQKLKHKCFNADIQLLNALDFNYFNRPPPILS